MSVKQRERPLSEKQALHFFSEQDRHHCDDGLASGYTMLAAIRFVKRETLKGNRCGPHLIRKGNRFYLEEVDELFCANIRTGYSFAVAKRTGTGTTLLTKR
jgi:predicted phosphoribosyltransferase